jgi:hypothetical protein
MDPSYPPRVTFYPEILPKPTLAGAMVSSGKSDVNEDNKRYELIMPDGSIIYLDEKTYFCIIKIQARVRGHLQRQVDRTSGFVRILFKLDMDFAACDQLGGKLTDPRWNIKMCIAKDVSASLNLPLHCTQVTKVDFFVVASLGSASID